MHQPVRRQAKTQSRAACCWNCSIFEPRVWQNVWVKRVIKFVQNSPSHFIIPLTFLCSFSLSSPLFPLSFSAFDPRTSWCSAEGVFFHPFPLIELTSAYSTIFFCIFFSQAAFTSLQFGPWLLLEKLRVYYRLLWIFWGWRDHTLQALDLLCAVEVKGEGWGACEWVRWGLRGCIRMEVRRNVADNEGISA